MNFLECVATSWSASIYTGQDNKILYLLYGMLDSGFLLYLLLCLKDIYCGKINWGLLIQKVQDFVIPPDV